jgi:hypothetical protein
MTNLDPHGLSLADLGEVLLIHVDVHPYRGEIGDGEHLGIGIDVFPEGQMLFDDGAGEGRPDFVAGIGRIRMPGQLLEIGIGKSKGMQLLLRRVSLDPRLGEGLTGIEVFLFAGHLFLPQSLLALEVGSSQFLAFGGRQVSRLGIGQFAAFDDRHDLPIFYRISQTLTHLAHYACHPRNHMGQAVGIKDDLPRQFSILAERARPGGLQLNAELLQFSRREFYHLLAVFVLFFLPVLDMSFLPMLGILFLRMFGMLFPSMLSVFSPGMLFLFFYMLFVARKLFISGFVALVVLGSDLPCCIRSGWGGFLAVTTE